MHDSIFEHEINVFPISEIRLMDLMEGFRHSYMFYTIRMFFYKNHGILPQEDGG